MRVLFDQGTPDPLRASLIAHNVSTAYERGWSNLRNGDLLNAAEHGGYEVLVSTDQSLKHQQNLSARRIGIVVRRLLAISRLVFTNRVDAVQLR